MKYTALLVTLALTGVFASGCLAAETEAEMQTEKEAVVRQQKNGFDEAQTELVEIGGFTVKIPSYWQAEEGEISLDGSDQEYYCAYAERQGKVALLQMEANVDDQESVTFSLLEDEEQEIAQAFGQSFDTYDCSQSELYELKGSDIQEIFRRFWSQSGMRRTQPYITEPRQPSISARPRMRPMIRTSWARSRRIRL